MNNIPRHIADYLASAPAFSWRAHHCGDFAARWVKIRTGRDPLAGIESAGLNGAVAVCRRYGSLHDAVTALLGTPEIPLLKAQPGDIVMMRTDSAIGAALGICCGREVAYTSPGGVVWVSIGSGVTAWRVA